MLSAIVCRMCRVTFVFSLARSSFLRSVSFVYSCSSFLFFCFRLSLFVSHFPFVVSHFFFSAPPLSLFLSHFSCFVIKSWFVVFACLSLLVSFPRFLSRSVSFPVSCRGHFKTLLNRLLFDDWSMGGTGRFAIAFQLILLISTIRSCL